MCIITYIPAGKNLPDKIIKIMFKNNPDGAGIAWRAGINQPAHYSKGFMTVQSVVNLFNKIPIEWERALHFRIATSGKISPTCCHPFPLLTNSLNKLRGEADGVVFHNGIIQFCTPREGIKSDMSDTMIFVKDYLSKLKNQLKYKHIQTLIEEATNSKFLIFNKCEEALRLGQWIEDGGIYYSNTSYKEFVYNSCIPYQESGEYIEIDTSKFTGNKENIYEIIKKAVENEGGCVDNVLYEEDDFMGINVFDLPNNCTSLAGMQVYRYDK